MNFEGDPTSQVDSLSEPEIEAHIQALDGAALMPGLNETLLGLLRPLLKSPATAVVEMGSGVGPIAFEVAGMVAESRLVAVDNSRRLLQELERRARGREVQNIEYVHANAQDTGLPSRSFDLVYSFELVNRTGPLESIVAEAKRILKPGGALVLAHYAPPSLYVPDGYLFTAAYDAWADQIYDPIAGSRFPAVAKELGLRDIDTRGALISTSDVSDPVWWPFFERAANHIAPSGLGDEERADAWIDALREANIQGKCMFSVPLFTLEARVPGISLRRG